MDEFREILDLIAKTMAILAMIIRVIKSQHGRVARLFTGLWRGIRNDIAQDVTKWRAMSRRRKLIGSLALAAVLIPYSTAFWMRDAAPFPLQVWVVSTVTPLMLYGICAAIWTTLRGQWRG